MQSLTIPASQHLVAGFALLLHHLSDHEAGLRRAVGDVAAVAARAGSGCGRRGLPASQKHVPVVGGTALTTPLLYLKHDLFFRGE